MSKSILYAVNGANQSLAIGDNVNFGSSVRRYGCNCSIAGGEVSIQGAGYYNINSSVTVTAGTAGTVVATACMNGMAIPGATASETLAENGVCTLTIPCMTRTYCSVPAAISVILTGVATTVTNASITVVKE